MSGTFDIAAVNDVLRGGFAPWVPSPVARAGRDARRVRLPFSDMLCRVGGVVRGQALMSMADTCLALVVSAGGVGFRDMATVSRLLRPRGSGCDRPGTRAQTRARAGVWRSHGTRTATRVRSRGRRAPVRWRNDTAR